MNNKALVAFASLSFAFSTSSFAEANSDSTFTTTVGAEYWGMKTETNEVSRDGTDTATLYAAVEHDVKYVPDARIRYSSIDSDFVAFDKLDLTLYTKVLEHDLMHFDLGVTFSQLSNTSYTNENVSGQDFDSTIWAWYGYAEITVPNTNIDVIGEMNFGDNSGIKSTDLMAGAQYRIPFEKSELSIRAGYRVIDFDSDEFKSELGKSFVMTNGFFSGVQYTF